MLNYKDDLPYFDREASWIQFNERVLQEAADPGNPLVERFRFLAIFSSNLDEFYRVRIAGLRSVIRLHKKERKELIYKPKKLLRQLLKQIGEQQDRFGALFREELLPALAREGINWKDSQTISALEKSRLKEYFEDHISDQLKWHWLNTDPRENSHIPANNQIYLLVRLYQDDSEAPLQAIVELPQEVAPRFISMKHENSGYSVLFLDDLLRMFIPAELPDYKLEGIYSYKINRDADLYLQDEYGSAMVEKIRKSLFKREHNLPSRFLYDGAMPEQAIAFLKEHYQLEEDDLVQGGRYHNFSDLFDFPFPKNPELYFSPLEPLRLPLSEKMYPADATTFQSGKGAAALFPPYHSYQPVVSFLEHAAHDSNVSSIKMTLYRVASNSSLCQALCDAARNGKEVVVFDEVQARFDEASNLYWGSKLEESGAEVLYSHDDLKVHAKICLVERKNEGQIQRQAVLSTGNFNEKTARVYSDLVLFTEDQSTTEELNRVFQHLRRPQDKINFQELWVAPHQLRDTFNDHIEQEIRLAQQGKPAYIYAKMNSLQDKKIIARLYAASQAGVNVFLIVSVVWYPE